MNAALPEKPSTSTSVSVVAQALAQTSSETRLLSGPAAASPVPIDLIPITCTWLASISRLDESRTVAPVAGWKVTADVIADRSAITNSGEPSVVVGPAEYVPPASSTMLPLTAFWNAPLNVAHAVAGLTQSFASEPVGDMKTLGPFVGSTVHA